MFNSKFSLSDLKGSNINQLVAADMMQIRGGKSGRKGSNKSKSRSLAKIGNNEGCKGSSKTPIVVAVDAA
jgi:hypothetical protein